MKKLLLEIALALTAGFATADQLSERVKSASDDPTYDISQFSDEELAKVAQLETLLP